VTADERNLYRINFTHGERDTKEENYEQQKERRERGDKRNILWPNGKQ